MKINILVRLKNKAFWIAIIPAIFLLIQIVARVFGYELDFGNLPDELIELVNVIFMILTIVGVVTDPTTKGIGDSKRALGYNEPFSDKEVKAND